MRAFLLFLFVLVACGSDSPAKYPTTRDGATALCSSMCSWAAECNMLETTEADCNTGCVAGVCNRAGVDCAGPVDDAQVDKCVADAKAHTGCAVDTPASCNAPFGGP